MTVETAFSFAVTNANRTAFDIQNGDRSVCRVGHPNKQGDQAWTLARADVVGDNPRFIETNSPLELDRVHVRAL